MLRITLERASEIKKIVYFLDWKKAFDKVNWKKLIGILNKKIGIDFRNIRLILNLYLGEKIKIRLGDHVDRPTL